MKNLIFLNISMLFLGYLFASTGLTDQILPFSTSDFVAFSVCATLLTAYIYYELHIIRMENLAISHFKPTLPNHNFIESQREKITDTFQDQHP